MIAMKCEKIQELLSEYIDNEINEITKKEIATHLEKCPKCQSEYVELKNIINLCGEMENIDLPENFETQLHTKLLECNKEKTNTTLKFANYIRIFSSVAAVLVLLFVSRNMFYNDNSPIVPESDSDSLVMTYSTPEDSLESDELTILNGDINPDYGMEEKDSRLIDTDLESQNDRVSVLMKLSEITNFEIHHQNTKEVKDNITNFTKSLNPEVIIKEIFVAEDNGTSLMELNLNIENYQTTLDFIKASYPNATKESIAFNEEVDSVDETAIIRISIIEGNN